MSLFSKIKFKVFNSYIISTISITFVLLTLGFFALLLFNTKDMSNSAKESIVITLILAPDAEKGQIDELQNQIVSQKYCKKIKVVTPDEAMAELKTTLGEEIDDVLSFNPLPTTININPTVEYSNSDSIQKIENKLKQIDIIDDVFYNKSMIYNLDKNIKKVTLAVIVLEFLLILMAISLISNTVRLLIQSKRFEIKTMQLVGATSWFVIKPFLTKSFFHGLISSLLSISFIVIGILYYQSSSDDIIKIKHIEEVFALILFAGLIITSLSTYFSVKNFLNSKIEDIY
jgi:cell division transport system permease protein